MTIQEQMEYLTSLGVSQELYNNVFRRWRKDYNPDNYFQLREDVIGKELEFHVSTIDFGYDLETVHIPDNSPALYFETMVSQNKAVVLVRRYSTQEEAAAGHRAIIDALRKGRFVLNNGSLQIISNDE